MLIRLPRETGNRPPNSPTHRLAQLPLHDLPHPPLNQHPRLQAPPLRSPAPLLRLRSLPRPAGARVRARQHPTPTRQSIPQPVRRRGDRGAAAGVGAVSEDCGGPSAVADGESGVGRFRAGSELGSECLVVRLLSACGGYEGGFADFDGCVGVRLLVGLSDRNV